MGRLVVPQTSDRVIGDGDRGVISGSRRNRWKRLVVLDEALRVEVPVVILNGIRSIESSGETGTVHVPFPRVIRAIAGGSEELGQELGPGRSHALPAAGATGQTRCV